MWRSHKLSLRLLAPMHIGWHKSSNLQQTRPYITGRVLWGALTERLTREAESVDYEAMGQKVDTELAFTYFYPSHEKDCVRLWPWEADWNEFTWKFLGSYVSTSLTDGHSAEEGSLHETEFVSPFTRDNEEVYLIGYIFERDGCELNWRSVINRLRLGGERSYGWGRVKEENVEIKEDKKIWDFDFEDTSDRPILVAPTNARLLAHTIADGDEIVGEIEPLVGRITSRGGGFGQCHSKAEICLKPGTKITTDSRFSIEPKGIWKKIKINKI